jgi:hypothetical protein
MKGKGNKSVSVFTHVLYTLLYLTYMKLYQNPKLHAQPQHSTYKNELPLERLIKTIPESLWYKFKGIKVNQRLGFTCNQYFTDINQLARWLGYHESIIRKSKMPYQTWAIKNFRPLTLKDLLSNTLSHPSITTLKSTCPARCF